MGKEHNHAIPKINKEGPLFAALILTSSFLIAEIIGGIMTSSLALISDAAHMLTDAVALAIALAAIRIGRRPIDAKRTYGYYRFEILAASFNAILLFLIAAYVIYEAYKRFFMTPEIQSMGMLIIATLGLIVNLTSMRLLTSGKDSSLNMKGAYLEVWSDLLGSIGVMAAAILIRLTGFTWIDSVIAIAIGIWVLPRAWTLLKESINILLEGVPEGIDLEKLNQAISKVNGVIGFHDLHVWAITSGKINLTAHIVVDKQYDCEQTLSIIRQMLASEFNIIHTTLQHERDTGISPTNNCVQH
ncbi:MAG TPA: cation diffusion facilitator family transporter [Gammaproteobacteria bacterium]|nr:cation diffusion facilitator family transporter [Gammaproteobacteria bacterium]